MVDGRSALDASVAMITYNGARYVEQQLKSIMTQTRPPNEIVVVDDGSEDATVDIARRVLSESGIAGCVHVNPERLGPAKNAERALSLTTGSVVFLADQDDVWELTKIGQVLRVLEGDSDADLVFTDAELIDADGNLVGRRLWDEVEFRGRARTNWTAGQQLDVLLRRPVVTGATMAVRRRLVDAALPVPSSGLHDEWIALVAAAHARRTIALPEPLIRYRIHAANVAGTPTLNPAARLRDYARGWQKRQGVLEQQEELLRRSGQDLPAPIREKVARSIAFRRRRQTLPRSRTRRVEPVLRDWLHGNYRRFARGPVSALFDLAAPPAQR